MLYFSWHNSILNTTPPGDNETYSLDDSSSDSESVSSWQAYSPITSDSESEHEFSEHSDTECSSSFFSNSDTEFVDQEQNITDEIEADLNSNSLQGVYSYRLVGDNIDKSIRHRYMRIDKCGLSDIHYFHFYALKDRIDFSGLSDILPNPNALSLNQLTSSLLPSKEDDAALQNNFSVLLSRILCDSFSFFKRTFDGVIEWHIKHPFYAEMCSKSEVVSTKHYLLFTYELLIAMYRYHWGSYLKMKFKAVRWWTSCLSYTSTFLQLNVQRST